MIIQYIYFCFYAAQMVFKKREANLSQTIITFSFTMTFYLSSLFDFLGVTQAMRRWTTLFPILLMATVFIASIIYFGRNSRNDIIIAYFKNKVGKWIKLHGIIGYLFFFGSGLIFYYTTSRLHYVTINEININMEKHETKPPWVK